MTRTNIRYHTLVARGQPFFLKPGMVHIEEIFRGTPRATKKRVFLFDTHRNFFVSKSTGTTLMRCLTPRVRLHCTTQFNNSKDCSTITLPTPKPVAFISVQNKPPFSSPLTLLSPVVGCWVREFHRRACPEQGAKLRERGQRELRHPANLAL